MGITRRLALALSLVVCCLFALSPASAQIGVAISVDVEPPPLPVYDQPPIPDTGYLWVTGYWAWDDDAGYYWVPGTWVLPPEPALLWTPGYWGWNDGVYVFHEGYWGPRRCPSAAATTRRAAATRAGCGQKVPAESTQVLSAALPIVK
jgi:WXXGXW repeat (2 copies)